MKNILKDAEWNWYISLSVSLFGIISGLICMYSCVIFILQLFGIGGVSLLESLIIMSISYTVLRIANPLNKKIRSYIE